MQKPRKINRQITGLIITVLFVSVAFCFIINACFLGDFFVLSKKNDMRHMYTYLNKNIEELEKDKGSFLDALNEYCENKSLAILIADENNECVLCTDGYKKSLMQHYRVLLITSPETKDVIKNRTKRSIFSQTNSEYGEDFLILVGRLSNNQIVFVRCAYGSLIEATQISNVFLIYVSILSIVIAGFLSYLMVSHYTRPLFDLIHIAKNISNFDFSMKYVPQRIYNELDDLGEHVNEMSTSLERSIEQLQRTNESLKHDLEVREETENMRKDFISNVSHELKTPIALIQGYAEGLQEGIMDDENSRQIYLDVIIDEANKMNRLVREMLVLNQLEAGQMKADMNDFDITEMIRGIVESNRIYFEAQDINFIFENEEPCEVYADEVLIEQVITNFMSNAIHYVMNENEIKVSYSFSKKNKVRIGIYNSGNNIPKKDIKQIWDKFYKADKARSREYGGSGIGLSVVKAIMDLMHEKFGVENLPGGVEFYLELTLAKHDKFKQNS